MTPDRLNSNSGDWLDHLYSVPGDEAAPTVARRLPMRRLLCALGFIVSAAMLGMTYYLQYAENLQPCPLCSMQRLLVGVMGIAFLTTALWNPKTRIAHKRGTFIALGAVVGIASVSYQLWFQAQPTDASLLCLPPLHYVIAAYPPSEVVDMTLRNPVGCNVTEWTFLGLNHYAWNAVGFAALCGLALGSRRDYR